MTLNLVQHRTGLDVWGRGARTRACDWERWTAAFAGGALVATGVRRRVPAGLLLALAGGLLAWWAAAAVKKRWTLQARAEKEKWSRLTRRPLDDRVNDASEQSFPASDAPPWTTGSPAGGTAGRH
jgi:hypothetical protein